MMVTELGIVTDNNSVQLEKALPAMPITSYLLSL